MTSPARAAGCHHTEPWTRTGSSWATSGFTHPSRPDGPRPSRLIQFSPAAALLTADSAGRRPAPSRRPRAPHRPGGRPGAGRCRRWAPTGGAARVGRLLQSAWRYKALIAAAVLVGALLGYGWAARQPTLYQGVARVLLEVPGSTSPPGDVLPVTPVDPGQYVRQQAQQVRSAPVLERAVKLTGNRISAETLRQRLEVEAAQDADVLTIRVVDSTATGAARLADAVATAYDQFLARQ